MIIPFPSVDSIAKELLESSARLLIPTLSMEGMTNEFGLEEDLGKLLLTRIKN